MAKITLEPGEQFAHSHAFESSTVLLAGEASLRMQGRDTVLIVNQPVFVPSDTEHVLVATGREKAFLDCARCSPPPREP
jgi:mannose-6-phosphate isomerase-like protein (cupin superfamily)